VAGAEVDEHREPVRQPDQDVVALDVAVHGARANPVGVRAVETFAQGLKQDRDVVRAALTTPWSTAQSERQMYGRASFDLLRRRVLLAA
jgi:transposase